MTRWLRWLNRTGKQTAWRFALWGWRMEAESRTQLKQRLRKTEGQLNVLKAERDHFQCTDSGLRRAYGEALDRESRLRQELGWFAEALSSKRARRVLRELA